MKPRTEPAAPARVHRYKYCDRVMATFVTVFVCSNVIGAAAALGADDRIDHRGEGIESAVVYPVAFYGIWTNDLKKAENEDYHDYDTDFMLFSIEV